MTLRFRTLLFAGTAALVALLFGAVALAVSLVLQRSARQEVAFAVARSDRLFQDLAAAHAEAVSLQARLLADEPRLKAVAATEEIDHDTVLSVLDELRTALSASVLLLTDADGRLLADSSDPTAVGHDLRSLPLVAQALANGDAGGVLVDEDGAHQVHARTVTFGATTAGVALFGRPLDAAFVARAAKLSGGTVAILNGSEAIALGSDEGVTALSQLDDQFLQGGGSYPGSERIRYVVARSIAKATEPIRRLTQLLFLALAVGVAVALASAHWLAGRISRPLDALTALAARIGTGDFTTQEVSGPREVTALARAMNTMSAELAASRAALVEKQRLEQELRIAARIQTAILPRDTFVVGFEMSTLMLPADEVGGDYFDVLPAEDGCWIGFGDVAGHGLPAGLVMLMLQSAVAAIKQREAASPRALLLSANRVLYENVRERMQQDEHATLVIVRLFEDGRMRFAGAHEDILVFPRESAPLRLPTPGTWVAVRPDIEHAIVESEHQLQPGDVVVLYTDGVTEAMNAQREQFGVERLVDTVARHKSAHVDDIRDAVLHAVRAWMARQDDDITLLVLRYETIT